VKNSSFEISLGLSIVKKNLTFINHLIPSSFEFGLFHSHISKMGTQIEKFYLTGILYQKNTNHASFGRLIKKCKNDKKSQKKKKTRKKLKKRRCKT